VCVCVCVCARARARVRNDMFNWKGSETHVNCQKTFDGSMDSIGLVSFTANDKTGNMGKALLS
jgi:hypothetical protein